MCIRFNRIIFFLAFIYSFKLMALIDCPGSPYKGDESNGWNNCIGIHTLSTGERYEGEFQNGRANGYGTYTNPSGEEYKGE